METKEIKIQVKCPDNRWYDYDSKDCKLKYDSDT